MSHNEKEHIPLATESPHAPVATANILGIHIIHVPPQAPKEIFARLHEKIEFPLTRFVDPRDIPLHIVLRIASHNDGRLRFQQHGHRLGPLVRTGRVTEARVEHDEAVKVRVVRGKETGAVNVLVVVHDCADLHVAVGSLDYGAVRVAGDSWRERELVIPVGHSLGTNKDEVDAGQREKMGELGPGIAWERGLGARTKNEEAHGRCL